MTREIPREQAETEALSPIGAQPEIVDNRGRALVHELHVQRMELEIQKEELRRVSAELEQSRNQFSLLFHQAPIGYLVLNEIGLIYEVNETFCRMVERARSRLLGNSFAHCLERNSQEPFLGRYPGFFRKPAGKSLEAMVRRERGAAFYAHLEGTTIRTALGSRPVDGTPLLLLAVTDISERKWAEEKRLQLERQMQQTQRLESLGVLAGGIAHDFNNLLAIILGNANLAMEELPADSPARDSLHAIEATSLRAAELCRQMLAYSGKGWFAIETMDLNALIDEMVALLKASIAKKTTLNLALDADLPALRGDPSQIRQVVMNLVINAAEAIGDEGGVVTISTGALKCTHEELSDAYLNETLNGGLYAWLEIADSGCGMDADTQRRIFEPFFTTKFTGRGLGLSAVLGIVRGHHGALRVRSVLGQGTTIRVFLPALQTAQTETGAVAEIAHADWRGTGTILLVDDEESVRVMVGRMLERLGFQVLTAANGREALYLYQARRARIVMVLLDLTMPVMDGEEAFTALRRINPQLRVVLSSGFTESEIAPRFAGLGLAGFLQKPYALYDLARCLHRVLNSPLPT